MDRLAAFCTLFLIGLALCQAAENAQMAKLRKDFDAKLSTLSKEGQIAAKKMMELFEAKLPREETQSLVEELMDKFSDKVKKELETLRPKKNGKIVTMNEIFAMIDAV